MKAGAIVFFFFFFPLVLIQYSSRGLQVFFKPKLEACHFVLWMNSKEEVVDKKENLVQFQGNGSQASVFACLNGTG
jgi:hypothetical protein